MNGNKFKIGTDVTLYISDDSTAIEIPLIALEKSTFEGITEGFKTMIDTNLMSDA